MAASNYLDLRKVKVIRDEIGVDAYVAEDGGNLTLIINPNQSFEAAFLAVRAVLPDAHPDNVRDLIRKSLPELVSRSTVEAKPIPAAVPAPPSRFRRLRMTINVMVAVAVLAGAVGAGIAVGQHGRVPESEVSAAAAAAAEHQAMPAPEEVSDESAFDRAPFPQLATSGFMRCDPMAARSARCTIGGEVYFAEVFTGGLSNTILFSAGDARLGFSEFPDDVAANWQGDEVSTPLTFANMVRVGRFIAWGTDAGHVKELADALNASGNARCVGVTDSSPFVLEYLRPPPGPSGA